MPFPSKPRKLTVSGGPKANRHKVKPPTKIRVSGKPKDKPYHKGSSTVCRRAMTTRDCPRGHEWR